MENEKVYWTYAAKGKVKLKAIDLEIIQGFIYGSFSSTFDKYKEDIHEHAKAVNRLYYKDE